MGSAIIARKKALEVLVDLHKGVNRTSTSGICGVLDSQLTDEQYRDFKPTLRKLFRSWEGFSGNDFYPVTTHYAKLLPSFEFELAREAGTLWKGEYGRKRIELLNHMLHELHKMVDKDNQKLQNKLNWIKAAASWPKPIKEVCCDRS